jgi:ubiquitin-conjugating enzyme E2 Z
MSTIIPVEQNISEAQNISVQQVVIQSSVPAQGNTFISKDTFRRLVKDVKEIVKNPLHSHGIYYIHNEDEILKGKALIIGPSETPYENGYYLFDFSFPTNYPHSPPEVKFCTNDGRTRFNPNLYTQGKVCLSILNTWQGEQWTGCQTISSILLALCTVLNSQPLLNEPGINDKHSDFNNYNKIITYKNFDIAMLQVLTNEYTNINFPMFIHIMQSKFIENFDNTIRRLTELCNIFPKKEKIQTSVYKMEIVLDYNGLLEKFHELKKNFTNI